MNWIDVTILVIIGWFAWRGLTTGLLKGIARLAGIFLGIVFAMKYDSQLADFAGSKWHLTEKLSNYFAFPTDLWNDSMPWWSSNGLSFTGGEQIQNILSMRLLEIIAFLLIFLVVYQLTYFAGVILSQVARMAFIGPVDRLGGLALGLVNGLVIVLILVALLTPLQIPVSMLNGGQPDNWYTRSIQSSVIIPKCRQFLTPFEGKFIDLIPDNILPTKITI
ncbi:MAG: CvpA family protein [Eubacteriales bacterium]